MRLDPAPHPFEVENAEAIDAYWQRISASNPALYDGRLVLHSDLAYRDGRLVGSCREVRFATFMYWRERRGAESAEHAYAHAALISNDNALVAIRMGRHTAAPDSVYFAAGSFEPMDFSGGACDMDANMVREVREETGLDIARLRRDAQMQLFSLDKATALFRRYWLDEPAERVAGRIRDFVTAEPNPEIEEPVIIRRGEALPRGIMPHMVAFARWHFGEG